MALYDPTPTTTPAERALRSFLTDTAWTMRAAKQLGISHMQVGNLAVLASYLRKLPADYGKFSMRHFYMDGGVGSEWAPTDACRLNECGTSACAAGHGPAAGVAPQRNETWGVYIRRVFTGQDEYNGMPYGVLYGAMFHESWAPYDNTVRGAAARILYVLDNPENAEELAHVYDPELYADYVA